MPITKKCIMKRPLLTIAMPTYNRNAILVTSLKRLIPQLNQECELLIIDNNSSMPVEESLGNVLQEVKNDCQIRILRNKSNIGGSANIIRCFEESAGIWTWLLGDDDEVQEGAIEIIFKMLGLFEDYAFFNFSSIFHANDNKNGIGLLSFIEDMHSFSNVLFISSGVYKTNLMQDALFVGYNFVYTAAPHVAMIMSVIKKNRKYGFSESMLVNWKSTDPEGNWNWLKVNVQLLSLLKLPFLSKEEKRIFSLRISNASGLRSYRYIFYIFTRVIITSRSYKEEYPMYKSYFFQWIVKSPCIGIKSFFQVCFAFQMLFLLNFQQISFFLIRTVFFLFGEDINKIKVFPRLKNQSF